jgi:hypothetical protein
MSQYLRDFVVSQIMYSTNSTEQSPPEDNRVADQKIPLILWNPTMMVLS